MAWWRRMMPGGQPVIKQPPDPAALTAFEQQVLALNQDPYLCVVDPQLRVLSVFDDLTYDRSDLDMLSAGMRNRVIAALQDIGCRQASGKVMHHQATDVRFLFTDFHALGASPFDISRYIRRRPQDYLVMTPTQVACQIIDHRPFEEALDRIKALISEQPINIYRLLDYLEHKPAHLTFSQAIGHLDRVQREAVSSEPLLNRRALK